MSFLWFAGNAIWAPMISVILPFLVLRDVGNAEKDLALSLVTTLGAIVASLAHPFGGWASDRTRTAWGRRRPYLIGGGCVSAIALGLLTFHDGFVELVIAVLILQLAYNVLLAAYQAYIPEIAPESSRGRASGFLGLMSALGSLFGLLGAIALLHNATYGWLLLLLAALLLGACAVTVWGVPEGAIIEPPVHTGERLTLSAIKSRYRDFGWVLLTRALVMLAFYTLLYYLAYDLRDVVHVVHYTTTTSEVEAVTIVVAALCSVWSGTLSDRIGRKGLVSFSGVAMALAALAFVAARSVPVVLAVGVLFGIGYGVYISVDWALITDVLPDQSVIARDMGIWGLAITVPQALTGVLGGIVFLLFPGGGPRAYVVLFSLTCVYAGLGSVLVWRVRGVR